MRRRVLLPLLTLFLFAGCSGGGSGGSPTAPAMPTTLEISRNWTGSSYNQALVGASCMGEERNALFAGDRVDDVLWSIGRNGSELTVTEADSIWAGTRQDLTFSGSIDAGGQISLAATATNADEGCSATWVCEDGRAIELCVSAGDQKTFEGSLAGSRITGIMRVEFWAYNANTDARLGRAEWVLDYDLG